MKGAAGWRRRSALGALAACIVASWWMAAPHRMPEPIARSNERLAEKSEPVIEQRSAEAAHAAPATSGATEAWDPSSPPGTDPSAPRLPAANFPYPPGSQPLLALADPTSQDHEDVPVDPATGAHCVFGPRSSIVHPPDALVIDLEVLDARGVRLAIRGGTARFRADGTTAERGPWFAAPFTDDKHDHAYAAAYQPTDTEQQALFEGGTHVFVEVSFQAPGTSETRTYGTAMQYARRPNASLSGHYVEAKENGSLVVRAGVSVQKASDYRVIASLASVDGERPIAFASSALHLEPGEGSVPLLFFGKILRDRGIDGPYRLENVMLFEEHPGADVFPGDKIAHAYTTAAYRASAFGAEAFQAPPFEGPVVDQDHPSQRNKPPPMFSAKDRLTGAGPTARIRAD